METNELIKYLKGFGEQTVISFVVLNPDKDIRKIYPVKQFMALSDSDAPCFLINVGNAEPLDESK